MQVITSQSHRDSAIVASKIEALRGEASVTMPVIPVGLDNLYILVDGHHTHEAAKQLGLVIDYRVIDATEDDRASLAGDTLLEAMWMDGEYRYLDNGRLVW